MTRQGYFREQHGYLVQLLVDCCLQLVFDRWHVPGVATCSDGNDYVKLYAIAGTTGGGGKVPEPSALLLFGTGLMGLVGLRRRTKGKTA